MKIIRYSTRLLLSLKNFCNPTLVMKHCVIKVLLSGIYKLFVVSQMVENDLCHSYICNIPEVLQLRQDELKKKKENHPEKKLKYWQSKVKVKELVKAWTMHPQTNRMHVPLWQRMTIYYEKRDLIFVFYLLKNYGGWYRTFKHKHQNVSVLVGFVLVIKSKTFIHARAYLRVCVHTYTYIPGRKSCNLSN